MDLLHHGVAGVDAEAALDAAKLRAFANIDAGGADGDTLHAVDAIAGGFAVRARAGRVLQRLARLAAVNPVCDVKSVRVCESSLDAWPGAHVEADLFAHMTGEGISGEGENPYPQISDER